MQVIPWIQIILSIILTLLVLLQQSEAGLGSLTGDFSGSGVMHGKRGMEKVLFIATITVSILFVAVSVWALLVS
ncbi:MAG: preprotein translocase subunit SecG [Candidatus Vogelbacteria bacterium]|nr:preprotein translocase subunit SecG [Candidatus Vogelbacteria bacterium]